MRLCLNMIVKNEAAVIERCIRSVLPHIQCWSIVDTGSNDGTQDTIRRLLRGLPGELIERPWVDFSTNRNQALDLARKYGDYALVIDADDVLEVDPRRSFAGLDRPGYAIEIAGPASTYWRDALLRLDVDWVWKGVLHEYPTCSRMDEVPRLGGLRIRVIGGGARSQVGLREKYLRDAALLRRGLADEPDNTRYAFYLAQSLRDAGELEDALTAYQRRIDMGGWEEEIFFSKFCIAVIEQRLGYAFDDVVAAYLAAWHFRPQRAEPVCYLAGYLLEEHHYEQARDYARIACATPVPEQGLQVNRAAYGWVARRALAGALFALEDYAQCIATCRDMLADPLLPPAERARVGQNIAAATRALDGAPC
jgi:glycosyltransferase involved in cell wall biosynthesis